MLSNKKFNLNLSAELKSQLAEIFHDMKTFNHDTENLPEAIKELIPIARDKMGLKENINEFTITGSSGSRLDGALIEPSVVGTIGRIVINLFVKEIYGIVTEGVPEFMKAYNLRKQMTGEKKKKIKLPQVKPSQNIVLEDNDALFLAPPKCNFFILSVQKDPKRFISISSTKQIMHIRPKDYKRITIVIDFHYEPSEAEMKKFMQGLNFGPIDEGEEESPSYVFDLEQQLNEMTKL